MHNRKAFLQAVCTKTGRQKIMNALWGKLDQNDIRLPSCKNLNFPLGKRKEINKNSSQKAKMPRILDELRAIHKSLYDKFPN